MLALRLLVVVTLFCLVMGMHKNLQPRAIPKQTPPKPVVDPPREVPEPRPEDLGLNKADMKKRLVRSTKNLRDEVPIGAEGHGLNLPPCWIETWAKPAFEIKGKYIMHHTGVAYMRYNKGKINVQFYCNHGTCPGFRPRRNNPLPVEESFRMHLVDATPKANAAECPEYLLTCDMLRTTDWTADNPKYFRYLKEGHVCNTDSMLERFAFDNNILDVNMLNHNPRLLQEAYRICSQTVCELPGAKVGPQDSIFPPIYNVWNNPNYEEGLFFTETDPQFKTGYKASLHWKPPHGPPDGVSYASLTPPDENDSLLAMLKIVIKNLAPVRRAVAGATAPGEKNRERRKQVRENKIVANPTQFEEGISQADFVISSGDVTAQPLPSQPGWVSSGDNWFAPDAFQDE